MPMPKCKEREIALVNGKKTYFTGKPCKHGHIADRNTIDCSCTVCRVEMYPAHREWNRQYAIDKRANMTPDERAAYHAAQSQWRKAERQRHPERVRARERKHSKLKRQRYPHRKLAEVRARQAAKIQRTPPWADLKAIRAFYEACPPDFEVDHIVPLRGRLVSGLHVLKNLQYLPKVDNRLKGSTFDPETFAA